MFGVPADRFNHQVEFIGAVDFSRHAVAILWRDELGFGEVVQTIKALGVMVFHKEHHTGTALRPGEQG